jgi:hypothetical protein
MWAMLQLDMIKVHVENEERSRYFEAQIETLLLADNEQDIIKNYFGLKPGECDYHFDPRISTHVITLKQQKYEELMAMGQLNIAENINDLASACLFEECYEAIGERLKQVEGWTATEFGKDTLDSRIKQYFNGHLDPNNMGNELGKIDGIAYIIKKARSDQLDEDCKNIWHGIIACVDKYIKSKITYIIDETLIAYNQPADAVINDITSRDMQLFKYALEHACENSAQKSHIIGSWFDEKIKDLRPDELETIITRVNEWCTYYQSIGNHFADMHAEKQQGWQKISSSLMRNGVLKKAGFGALLIGVGFAASQLYQHIRSTSVSNSPEDVKA